MGPLQVVEKKIKEYEQLVQEYQLKLKEWEGSHGKMVGELESIISDLRKNISRKDDKMKGTRLAKISETLKLKKQSRGKKISIEEGGEGEGKGTNIRGILGSKMGLLRKIIK